MSTDSAAMENHEIDYMSYKVYNKKSNFICLITKIFQDGRVTIAGFEGITFEIRRQCEMFMGLNINIFTKKGLEHDRINQELLPEATTNDAAIS